MTDKQLQDAIKRLERVVTSVSNKSLEERLVRYQRGSIHFERRFVQLLATGQQDASHIKSMYHAHRFLAYKTMLEIATKEV